MLRFKEFLMESVSSIVYHMISFDNAHKALEGNYIKANGGLSTTRSLTGKYHINYRLIGVIFEFDGDKVNQKYKGHAHGTDNFTYYGNPNDDLEADEMEEHGMSWKEISQDPDYMEFHGKDNGQLEDVIKPKNKRFEPLDHFVKSAIMFLPKEFLEGNYKDRFDEEYLDQIKYIERVETQLNAKNIPIRYVTSVKGLFNRSNNQEEFNTIMRDYADEDDELE
tara:strand:- start:16904 stop:17569 length:666 start_codon:yes stop_codon:yes gene_type:complete